MEGETPSRVVFGEEGFVSMDSSDLTVDSLSMRNLVGNCELIVVEMIDHLLMF